jgi:DNA-binding transcriptional MerR regulator
MRPVIKQVLDEVVTSKELAKILDVSEDQIRKLVMNKKIESVLKGKTRLYDPKDFVKEEHGNA